MKKAIMEEPVFLLGTHQPTKASCIDRSKGMNELLYIYAQNTLAVWALSPTSRSAIELV